MDREDEVLATLLIAAYGWVPRQVKAVFAEVTGMDVTVHLGCDVRDERVRDAEEDIGVDVENEVGRSRNFLGVRTHESPDIAEWRRRGWFPVHLAAEWGEDWIEPGDEIATASPAPGWSLELAESEVVRTSGFATPLPPYTAAAFLVELARAAAGQISPLVEAVNVVVDPAGTTIYWHLDGPPDTDTTRAMNITAARLQRRTSLDFTQCWYVNSPSLPTDRWDLFFGRDDPRTWAQREADDDAERAER